MLNLKAKIRKKIGGDLSKLRKEGILPAILYGSEINNLALEISKKEFEKVYQEAGKSSLICLELESVPKGLSHKKGLSPKYEVLIHDLAIDPVDDKILHIDFYHPSAKKQTTASIPLTFENEEIIEKTIEGNLIKEFQSIEVKSLPQNLPKEIKIDLAVLKQVGDKIKVKDLNVPAGVKILKDPEEVVAVIAHRKEYKEKERQVPVEEESPEIEKTEEKKEKEKKRN